jgi:hypothetical protein
MHKVSAPKPALEACLSQMRTFKNTDMTLHTFPVTVNEVAVRVSRALKEKKDMAVPMPQEIKMHEKPTVSCHAVAMFMGKASLCAAIKTIGTEALGSGQTTAELLSPLRFFTTKFEMC